MNSTRLDAALSAALEESRGDADARWLVAVRLNAPFGPRELERLAAFQPPRDAAERLTLSLVLGERDIDWISDLPVVRSLRLAQRLRALPRDAGPTQA